MLQAYTFYFSLHVYSEIVLSYANCAQFLGAVVESQGSIKY